MKTGRGTTFYFNLWNNLGICHPNPKVFDPPFCCLGQGTTRDYPLPGLRDRPPLPLYGNPSHRIITETQDDKGGTITKRKSCLDWSPRLTFWLFADFIARVDFRTLRWLLVLRWLLWVRLGSTVWVGIGFGVPSSTHAMASRYVESQLKVNPESTQSQPKVNPKSTRGQSKVIVESYLKSLQSRWDVNKNASQGQTSSKFLTFVENINKKLSTRKSKSTESQP